MAPREATPHLSASEEARVVGQVAPSPAMPQQQQPPRRPVLRDLLLPVGRQSQAFEQDSEESWVVLWAVIVFTALLAEALIWGRGAPSPAKTRLQHYPTSSLPKGRIGPILLFFLKYSWLVNAL